MSGCLAVRKFLMEVVGRKCFCAGKHKLILQENFAKKKNILSRPDLVFHIVFTKTKT